MAVLPKIIASSVIRSAGQGQDHGAAYLVDLETGQWEQVIHWSEKEIDWEGRGSGRGLRGIAIHRDQVFVAASDCLLVYDRHFRLQASYRNKYLEFCHEIAVWRNEIHLTSTGYDSVLTFSLSDRVFTIGYCLRFSNGQLLLTRLAQMLEYRVRHSRHRQGAVARWMRRTPTLRVFDARSDDGPRAGDTVHLNMVYPLDGALLVSGTMLGGMVMLSRAHTRWYSHVPYGAHNARPLGNDVLLNDTAADMVAVVSRRGQTLRHYPILRYDEEQLSMAVDKGLARQSFGRGLCLFRDSVIIGGSSPATVSAYALHGAPQALTTVNVSMDVRNSIHGLEIWPF